MRLFNDERSLKALFNLEHFQSPVFLLVVTSCRSSSADLSDVQRSVFLPLPFFCTPGISAIINHGCLLFTAEVKLTGLLSADWTKSMTSLKHE